ncbi:MAG: mandelate racemase/muconate lactonizing enzyme family protein [Kiloniellales bacterium]
MKVVKIETFTRRFVALVRVTLEDGTLGIGQMSPYHADFTTEVFHRFVASAAINRSAEDIAALVEDIFSQTLKFPGTFMCRAMAGLDTALWDAAGKRAGLPVYALLGGKDPAVPVYASSMCRKITPEDEARRFLRLRDEQGFRSFKFRVGRSNGRNQDAWPGRTPQVAHAVGTAFRGEGVRLLADGNSCYDAENAIEVGRMLADAGVEQFEEPCPYWDYDATREVRDALEIDVSGGEQDFYLPGWRYMVRSNVVDICQPDLCYVGGVSRLFTVAKIAASVGKPVILHAANDSLVTLFSLHAFAALPNAGDACEFNIEGPEYHDPLLRYLYEPALSVSDGRARLNGEPGWGIRPTERWLDGADYRVLEAD